MKYVEKYSWAILIIFLICGFLKPAIWFLILGSIVFGLTIESISFMKKMARFGVKTEGIILSYEKEKNGYKTPIVEFLSDNDDLIKESLLFMHHLI